MTAPLPSSQRPERGFRRALASGLLVSVLLHVALALAWRTPVLAPPGSSADVRSPEPRPRAGRALRALAVREEERTEIPPPPAPLQPAAEPEVHLPRTAESTLPAGELEPRESQPGRSGGGDERSGVGEEGGPRVRPPVPRSVLPEWDAPESVRGNSVTVRVHVDSAGSPTGPVELVPPTSSEDFNRRLVRKVREMRFSPARDPRGRAVAAWAELTFTF